MTTTLNSIGLVFNDATTQNTAAAIGTLANTSGYTTFSNGLTLQWGDFTSVTRTAEQVRVFSIPFTSYFIGGIVVPFNAATEQMGYANAGLTSMNVVVGSGDASPRSGKWFALGV